MVEKGGKQASIIISERRSSARQRGPGVQGPKSPLGALDMDGEAMAQSGAGAETIHTGAGVARRAAFHERRRADAAERATSDAGDEALLHNEAQAGGVRLVPAEEVQLTPPGANYFVLTPECSKRERREKRSRLAAAGAAERAPEDPPTRDGRHVRSRTGVDTRHEAGDGDDDEGGGERTVSV